VKTLLPPTYGEAEVIKLLVLPFFQAKELSSKSPLSTSSAGVSCTDEGLALRLWDNVAEKVHKNC